MNAQTRFVGNDACNSLASMTTISPQQPEPALSYLPQQVSNNNSDLDNCKQTLIKLYERVLGEKSAETEGLAGTNAYSGLVGELQAAVNKETNLIYEIRAYITRLEQL